LLRAPSRFIAIAIDSCASGDNAPSDMPAESKRLRIASTGSTSSSGIGCSGDSTESRSRSADGARLLTASA